MEAKTAKKADISILRYSLSIFNVTILPIHRKLYAYFFSFFLQSPHGAQRHLVRTFLAFSTALAEEVFFTSERINRLPGIKSYFVPGAGKEALFLWKSFPGAAPLTIIA
ncbi:MAG TPA: hypothetical protein VHO46_03650 [Bacteroidales bacterium]|nr:hypothetical protein [Bacteroidales bacterium]